jgi:hypothetical protein
MFNIGDRVRSLIEVGYGDVTTLWGIVVHIDNQDELSVGVRFPGLTTGHDLDRDLGTEGWWCFPDHLELLEPVKMLADPLFTLEEITECSR